MSDCGKRIRLNRVLGGSTPRPGRAFDHALVLGPIPGTEDPLGKIRQFAQADVDALLLNLGLIRQFANSTILGPIPSLIARRDWTTIWLGSGNKWKRHAAQFPFSRGPRKRYDTARMPFSPISWWVLVMPSLR